MKAKRIAREYIRSGKYNHMDMDIIFACRPDMGKV